MEEDSCLHRNDKKRDNALNSVDKKGEKMKKILFIMVLLLVSILVFGKPSLAIDAKGYPIQLAKSFTTAADTVVTVADSIAVPSNTVEVEILVKDQIVYITDGLSNRANTYWIQVPTATKITLPVMNNSYIRYKALTGNAKLYFIWRRM